MKARIGEFIDDGSLEKLRSLSREDYGNYNPLFHAAESDNPRALEIMRHLVEDRGFRGGGGLARALDCEHFDIAEYLYRAGEPVRVSARSLAVMQWVLERGATIGEGYLYEILDLGLDSDREQRLSLFMQLNRELSPEAQEELADYRARQAEKERLEALPCECYSCHRSCDAGASCEACGGALCNECGEKGAQIFLKEWLGVSNKCEACGILVCSGCTRVCYACANENLSEVLCVGCAPALEDVCSLHDWRVCAEHENEQCGECYANRNYGLKMG